ncbi:MAG: activator of HSP90 ATPase [Cytophagaceae bacterium]|nr:activator of HSP90 ATPase [Cytophagaceae bacterium]
MSELSNRTLTIEKTFNAPVKLVWDAWTKSEHLLKWWAPNGMDLKLIKHDFKVGGQWKYAMPLPDGNVFISEGTYKEIVEYEKIITTADFKPMTQNVELQTYFKADGKKTKFTFNVIHATAEYCKKQEEMGFYNGWGSAFNRLENVIQNLEK